ncbi:rod shape-determining protein MreD [Granulicella cerasi]|uniref:Rod shape-determining protein MreD n=1 Tax=Granulicella cerasi TaxID=741063 RepID=A0ABW1ZAR5_9BACT|nr:rod shape-determining protein MreD [Granulicella cerasi]
MAEHSYTSRQELDQYYFHPVVTVLAPLVLLLLQTVLPKAFPRVAIFDLPLIAVIFFSVARRSPISGAFTGMFIGLFQDGLTSHPFGVWGIAKSVVGYLAASVGFAVDMDNIVNRSVLTFVASLIQSAITFLIERFLLGDLTVRFLPAYGWPLHELIRAAVNTAIAIPLFFLLDRFKQRE